MDAGKVPQSVMIVMADGNIEDHERVKKASRECGINHVFTSVYNGAQLMDLLFKRGAYAGGEDVAPNLIIMDIHLDLVDGFTALKQIKNNPATADVPVYILSRERSDPDVKKALEAGALDYFKKPLKFEELKAIVFKICKVCFREMLDKKTGTAGI